MVEGKKKNWKKNWEDWSIPAKVGSIVGGVILAVGLFFLFGFIVMSLWNWLMPKIFGLPALGYWEAWGVLLLSCILFGRIGGGSRSSERGRKRKLRARLQEMDEECEEEKEQKA
ncbi:MAG: hypothetical protein JXD23_14660 [Spirochaetales bacterium]|nr:hypothetical protein [Spirochaetales bacterium]